MNCYYARDSVKQQFIDFINATGRATAGDVWITLERKGHYPELEQGPVMQDEGAKGCKNITAIEVDFNAYARMKSLTSHI